jgi:VanZ family protein
MTKYHWYPLLWLAFITGLSVMPSVQLPRFDLFSGDKLAHAIVYGVLSWLLLYGWEGIERRPLTTKVFGVTVLCSTLYGILMEWVQFTFVPGRMYEPDDMIANCTGALAGGFLYKFFSKRKRKNR